MAPDRLRNPQGLRDMLLSRINCVRAVGGGMVLRYCVGRFGVTRREWVLIALLQGAGPVASSELAARAQLDKSGTSMALVELGGTSRAGRGGGGR